MAGRLLKNIFGSQRKVDWQFDPGGVIWKLFPARDGILVGEARDVDRRTMTLFAVRIADGSPIFSGVQTDEPWWIALEMTIGDLAILHRYPKPDLPNALGATVIDCQSGEILWQDAGIRVLCGTEEVALAQRGAALDHPQLEFIDARTGAVLEELGADIARAQKFQRICEGIDQFDDWISATQLDESHPKFDRLSTIVERERVEGRGQVEVAEYREYAVIGMHQRSQRSAQAMLDDLVDAFIVVLDGDRVIFKERVTADAPGASEDIFFIWRGRLIFIRDRKALAAIDLQRK